MDIRLPLGLLFAVLGALLTGFGVTTISSRIYADHSLGINVSGAAVSVNGAKVVKTDIGASNGVIHVIDTVLIPADK